MFELTVDVIGCFSDTFMKINYHVSRRKRRLVCINSEDSDLNLSKSRMSCTTLARRKAANANCNNEIEAKSDYQIKRHVCGVKVSAFIKSRS